MVTAVSRASRHTDPRTRELLRLLWRGGEFGYFWRLSDKRTNWVRVRHFESQLDLFGPGWEQDVFFAVHPCRDFRTSYERGRVEDVASVACAFADVDAAEGETLSDLLARVGKLARQPSAVVASGRGVHCYWLFNTCIPVDSEATRRELVEFQRMFAIWGGGDRNASDLARVLRLPNTLSTKHGRWVEWVTFNPDRSYSYHELRELVMCSVSDQRTRVEQDAKPRMPAQWGAKQKRAVDALLRWLAHQRPGNRNCATYWTAHRLREAGVTLEHAQALLVPLAVALGLPAREAERTIASAYKGGRGIWQ